MGKERLKETPEGHYLVADGYASAPYEKEKPKKAPKKKTTKKTE